MNQQIDKSLKRWVKLHQGSFITIDETEALTAIDVNSGQYTGTHNKEETFLQVNLAASKEIAKQIRLRNISGIIIIDFINMKSKANYDVLLKNLNRYFKADRSKVMIHGVTNLGLVEVTRKKNRKSLKNQLMATCQTCDGGGYVQSFNLHFKRLEDKIKTLKYHTSQDCFMVQVSQSFFEALNQPLISDCTYLHILEEKLEVKLSVTVQDTLEEYTFKTSVEL